MVEAFHCGVSSSSSETEAAAPPLKLPLYENLWKAAIFLPVPAPREAVNSNSNMQECRASQKRSISAE